MTGYRTKLYNRVIGQQETWDAFMALVKTHAEQTHWHDIVTKSLGRCGATVVLSESGFGERRIIINYDGFTVWTHRMMATGNKWRVSEHEEGIPQHFYARGIPVTIGNGLNDFMLMAMAIIEKLNLIPMPRVALLTASTLPLYSEFVDEVA